MRLRPLRKRLVVEAAYAPGDVFRDCDECPEVVAIAADQTFLLGAPDDEFGHDQAETPQVEVTLTKPFAIGVYEITYDGLGRMPRRWRVRRV